MHLVRSAMLDAEYVLTIMCELNVIPLALRITKIVGNLFVRTYFLISHLASIESLVVGYRSLIWLCRDVHYSEGDRSAMSYCYSTLFMPETSSVRIKFTRLLKPEWTNMKMTNLPMLCHLRKSAERRNLRIPEASSWNPKKVSFFSVLDHSGLERLDFDPRHSL